METVFLLHAFSTMAMVGLIWFVQIVHYPLFAAVGPERFAEYESSHQARTTIVVAPLMIAEALSAIALIWFRPDGVAFGLCVAGMMLVALLWASTFLWQVPAHERLQQSFDGATHAFLVRSNWLRTAGWSARGLLVCVMLYQADMATSATV
jgi:hypothetical protein